MIESESIMSYFSQDLRDEILKESSIREVSRGTVILHPNAFVKEIPIVVKGLLEVYYSISEQKDIFLYYIRSNESCIASFNSGMTGSKTCTMSVAGKDSTILMIPVQQVKTWIVKYPELNALFFREYNQRYVDLVYTLNEALSQKIHVRLYNYLMRKVMFQGSSLLQITHHQIAADLGTVREVITRNIRKLEKDGKIRQHAHYIEIYVG